MRRATFTEILELCDKRSIYLLFFFLLAMSLHGSTRMEQ